MSLLKVKNGFSKRDFIKVIKAVGNRCMYYFNYTRAPYLRETTFSNSALMSCESVGKDTIISYDYAKFKRETKDFNYNEQYIFATQVMAHEMRHYYQHRQIIAKRPNENKKTISNWTRKKIIKTRGMKKTDNYEYVFSSVELDANLYAHIFTFDHLESVSLIPIYNKTHFNALKKLYKQNGGKNIKKYFSRKMKKCLVTK